MAFAKIIFYVLEKVLSNLKKALYMPLFYTILNYCTPNGDQSRVALVVAFVFHVATIF